ncbi:hypothetical protein GCM10009821_29650 [Aeromicrobium halocynthiae]|uniref:DNA topoisomerase (ATP-hydrolyzing) n=1 Tax=Aeromicrobium halocynthiae TaxID=560557 RepID=A0ABN2W8I3_9ACTN
MSIREERETFEAVLAFIDNWQEIYGRLADVDTPAERVRVVSEMLDVSAGVAVMMMDLQVRKLFERDRVRQRLEDLRDADGGE